jgi:chromosome segregation ATPase
MSNGSDEIAEIRKRLEAIEKALDELRAGNLALKEIIAAIGQTIQDSETAGDATKAHAKSPKEISEHAKEEKAASTAEVADKVEDAEEAMHVAHAFMKKDNPVALPLKAHRRSDTWLVDVDVGAVRMEIVRVKIDAKTGNILGHETVEKK